MQAFERAKLCLRKYKKPFVIFDAHGNSLRKDPRIRESSLIGAFISIAFKILFLILLIYALVKLFSYDASVIDGEVINYNVRKVSSVASSYNTLDMPSLFFNVTATIQFYEKTYSSLAGVRFTDRKGFSKDFTSPVPAPYPAQGIYSSSKISLNTYDTNVSPIPLNAPNRMSNSMSLQGLFVQSSTNAYNTEYIKNVYVREGAININPPNFEDHDYHAFFRIPEAQLSRLKSCQLQILVVNNAEYALVKNKFGVKDAVSQLAITNSRSNSASWIDSSFNFETKMFQTGIFNTIYLTGNYRLSEWNAFRLANPTINAPLLPPKNAMDYMVFLNYVNNFKNIPNSLICTSTSSGSIFNYATSLVANSIGLSTTSLTLKTARSFTAGQKILVSGYLGTEEMTVTSNVNNGFIVSVSRTNPINFVTTGIEINTATSVPSGWKCDPRNYNSRDGCHCGCGVLDPDCSGEVSAFIFAAVNCPKDNYCSAHGVCVHKGVFSGVSGNITNVVVSEGCNKFIQPGESTTSGYIENSAASISGCDPCANDPYYKTAVYDANSGNYVCNYRATGIIDLTNSTIVQSLATLPANAQSFSMTVKLFNKSPFPVGVSFDAILSFGTSLAATFSTFGNQRTTMYQSLLFSPRAGGITSLLKHLSLGTIISASTLYSRQIIVMPTDYSISSISKSSSLMFPVTGPYEVITSTGQMLKVSGAKTISTLLGQIQLLSLSSTWSDTSYDGIIGRITQDSTLNGELMVEPQFYTKVNGIDLNFTNLVGKTISVYEYEGDVNTQTSKVVSVSLQSNWTCSFDLFYQKDGICNCGSCGAYDPDCSFPDRLSFLQKGGIVVGCGGQNCSAIGTCFNGPVPADQVPFVGLKWIIRVSPAFERLPTRGSIMEASSTSKTVSKVIDVVMTRGNDDGQFLPEDRYKSNTYENFESPSEIDFEVAFFRTSQKKTHAQLLTEVCPTSNTSNLYNVDSRMANTWSQLSTVQTNHTCSLIKAFPNTCKSATSASIEPFGSSCVKEMPITNYFSIETKYPINNKFDRKYMINTTEGSPQDAEILFDFDYTWTFTHGSDTIKADIKFGDNQKLGGDVLSTSGGNVRSYFGALSYLDVGNGTSTTPQPTAIPASNPYMNPDVTIQSDVLATKEILKEYSPYQWETKDNVPIFESVALKWEVETVSGIKGLIQLEPGYEWTFAADVEIVPQITAKWYHWSGVYTATYITSWKSVVSGNTITKTKSSDFEKNTMKVRYRINLNSKTSQKIYVKDYVFSTFISDFGSYLSIMGLSLTVLQFWQLVFFCFRPRIVNVFNQIKQIEKEEQEAEKETKNDVPLENTPVSKESVHVKVDSNDSPALDNVNKE